MKKLITLISFLLCLPAFAHAEYQRVVSLSPAVTEYIFELGQEDKLVGVTDFCDYPAAAKNKERVGGYLTPHIEKIISLDPDLVIVAKNGGAKAITARLQEFKIKTLIVEFYSVEDIIEGYRRIGDVLNVAERAQEKIDAFSRQIEHYKKSVQELKKKSVLFVRWHQPLTVASGSSLENEIIEIVGGRNVVTDAQGRYPRYSLEAVLMHKPEIIIDASYYDTPTSEQRREIVRFWSQWKSIPAVMNNRIYILNTDFHSVPGPRTMMLIDEVASIINPDIFKSKWGLCEKVNV